MEFHVHTYASLIVVRVMLSHNLTGKSDQLVVYTYRLFNRVEYTYNTIEREALAIIFVLHKFKHYLLSNKFVVYVDHMTLVYMVNKPHVLGRITRWLLLFLEYDFIVVYKPDKIHVVANALSRLLNTTEPTSVFDQTIDADLFYIKPKWFNDVKDFVKTL